MFQPFLPIRSASLQTILPTIWPYRTVDEDEFIDVLVDKEDSLRVLINHEAEHKDCLGVVVTLHGLTGSSDSSYNLRLTPLLTAAGFKVVRINLRGSGPGFGLAKKTYHSGQSDDLRAVLKVLRSKFAHLPFYGLGFSLGGNLLLKFLGEESSNGETYFRGFMAVSPPFDLMAAALHLKKDHRFWDRYFVKKMIETVEVLHDKFPELGRTKFPTDCSLVDFDDIYTAPRHGFGTVDRYYAECSSATVYSEIRVPGCIVGSHDDPIVCYANLPDIPPQIALRLTEYGGHCGFIGEIIGKGFFWLDQFILKWLTNHAMASTESEP